MNDVTTKYIAIETVIAVVFGFCLSAFFAYVAFGAGEQVPARALLIDAVPQGFMLGLMTTLIPTALTRKRMRDGRIAGLATGKRFLPRNILVRSVAVGVLSALILIAMNIVMLHILSIELPSPAAIITYKSVSGAALSILVAPFIIHYALKDAQGGRPA